MEDDNDEGQGPDRAVIDALHEKGQMLEAAAEKIGLYAQSMQIAQAADPTGQGTDVVLVGQFLLGNIAFSDRVQRPELEAEKDEFAKMEHDLTPDAEEIRQRIQATRDRLEGKKTDGSDEG